MEAQTTFYIVGGALVLLALVISAIGMRKDNFPSTAIMRLGVALVALVVAATGAFAVLSAQAEQEDRQDEQNREAAVMVEEQTAANAEAAGGGSASGTQEENPTGGGSVPGNGTGDEGSGGEVFTANGCGSCHTLTALEGVATGQVGPNLDEALVDKDTQFIETSIVDPGAYVEEGFGDDIMPDTYEEELTPQDLKDLVSFLAQATGAGGGTGIPGSGE